MLLLSSLTTDGACAQGQRVHYACQVLEPGAQESEASQGNPSNGSPLPLET